MPLVVEEKPICREALGVILARCTGQAHSRFATSIEEAEHAVGNTKPIVILIDLFTANYDFRLIRRFTAKSACNRIILIDDRVNPVFSSLSRSCGATGYLSKEFEIPFIERAISDILDGQSYYAVRHSPNQYYESEKPFEYKGAYLTGRQRDVLYQLSLGLTNIQIARALNISEGTVKTHVHAVLKLIGARNRTHAALIAGRFVATPKTL